MEISNKVVFITGGGSGMGAETAVYLSNKGAKIAVIDLDQEAAERVAKRIKGYAVKCNVTDDDEVEAAFNKVIGVLGTPQICVNCAGIAPAKRVIGRNGPMSLQDFEKVIAVNLVGTFNTLRLAAYHMSQLPTNENEQERGVIINTASIAAYEGQVGQAAYSASKGGICSLTLPVARELANFNIRVMTIAPGLINTPLVGGLPDEVQKGLAADIVYPKRLGEPLEFSMLVAHIIENPYLNGEVIRLDGGLRMQPK